MSTRSTQQLIVTVDQISPDADNVLLASLVTDDGQELTAPLDLLPEGTRIGDVLTVRFRRDARQTQARTQRVADLQKKLFGRGFEP